MENHRGNDITFSEKQAKEKRKKTCCCIHHIYFSPTKFKELKELPIF